MTSATVPQLWVWPPGSSADVPTGLTADFGPVHNGDWLLLSWNPPSAKPDIGYACTTKSGILSAVNAVPLNKTTSPYKYQVNFIPNMNNTQDTPYCHLWFPNSSQGNTVQWIYALDARPVASTYGPAGMLATSTVISTATQSASAALVSTTVTSTVTSTPTSASVAAIDSTSSASPSPQASSSSNAAVGAGVGVGVGVVALAAVGAIFWWLRRRKAARAAQGDAIYSDTPMPPAPHELHGNHMTELEGGKMEYYAKTSELRGPEAAHEMQ